MLFTEPLFLFLFLPALLGLTFVRRPHGAYANGVLAMASVVFYGVGGGWFTLLMLASILFNYRMAILVDRARETSCSFPSSSRGRSSDTARSRTSWRGESWASTTSPPASAASSSDSARRCSSPTS